MDYFGRPIINSKQQFATYKVLEPMVKSKLTIMQLTLMKQCFSLKVHKGNKALYFVTVCTSEGISALIFVDKALLKFNSLPVSRKPGIISCYFNKIQNRMVAIHL